MNGMRPARGVRFAAPPTAALLRAFTTPRLGCTPARLAQPAARPRPAYARGLSELGKLIAAGWAQGLCPLDPPYELIHAEE